MTVKAITTLGLLAASLLGGCALQPVEPWQREHLAKPEMAWNPGLMNEGVIRDHTYTSKEAAVGRPGMGGGGCGCN